jgi:hypothetical protein
VGVLNRLNIPVNFFRRLAAMKFFSAFCSALVLAIVSCGNASASTLIDEDVQISYIGTIGFTLSQLSFSGPGVSNIFASSQYAGPIGHSVSPGSGVLADQTAALILGDTYDIFAHGVLAGGGVFDLQGTVIASNDLAVRIGAGGNQFGITTVRGDVSPVPLPASFPLFALALLGLGALGYHSSRTKRRESALHNGGMLAEGA